MKQSFLNSCIIISVILLTTSCTQEVAEEPKDVTVNTAENSISKPVELPIENAVESEETSNYKWMLITGNLGLYQSTVMIDLKISNGKVSGKYFYARHQKYLDLNGTIEKDGLIKLKESYKGSTTGFLNFSNENGTISGIWSAKEDFSSPQKFNGKEITNINETEYSPIFERYAYKHSTSIYNGEDEDPDVLAVTDDLKINYISQDLITFYYHVTGANGHVGSIEGIANKTNDSTWIFTGEDECILTLKIDGKQAKIDEDNCQYYRGYRAYFDNSLERVK